MLRRAKVEIYSDGEFVVTDMLLFAMGGGCKVVILGLRFP